MNFTKSQVPKFRSPKIVTDPTNKNYSIFVSEQISTSMAWLNSRLSEMTKLQHLACSCRIMNIGIEQLLPIFSEEFRGVKIPHQISPTPSLHSSTPTPRLQGHLNSENEPIRLRTVRVIANCRSWRDRPLHGPFWTSSGTTGLESSNSKKNLATPKNCWFAHSMVYAPFNTTMTIDSRRPPPSNNTYRTAATKLAQTILESRQERFFVDPATGELRPKQDTETG